MDNLVVDGKVNINGILEVSGTADIGGRLTGRDGATISGSSTDAGLFTVVGSSKITQNMTVDGMLASTSVEFDSISVAGSAQVDNLIVESTAIVVGAATLGTVTATSGEIGALTADTFSVASGIEFVDVVAETVTIQDLTVTAQASIGGDLIVGGTFAPAVTEFQDLSVSGTANIGYTITGGASVAGDLEIGVGNLIMGVGTIARFESVLYNAQVDCISGTDECQSNPLLESDWEPV
jgi:hypothetical protein